MKIGQRIYGGYIDRGVRVGEVVAIHDCYVEWQVEGEGSTRVMLTRVAEEQTIGAPTGWVEAPGEAIRRQVERQMDIERGEELRRERVRALHHPQRRAG